jgi:hypothetical protein
MSLLFCFGVKAMGVEGLRLIPKIWMPVEEMGAKKYVRIAL